MAYCEKCGRWMGWSHGCPLWWQATTDPSDDPERFGDRWDLASGDTAGEAAEAYAEKYFHRGDYPKEFDVYVRPVGGEWEIFSVNVVSEPVFELTKLTSCPKCYRDIGDDGHTCPPIWEVFLDTDDKKYLGLKVHDDTLEEAAKQCARSYSAAKNSSQFVILVRPLGGDWIVFNALVDEDLIVQLNQVQVEAKND